MSDGRMEFHSSALLFRERMDSHPGFLVAALRIDVAVRANHDANRAINLPLARLGRKQRPG
jgi:hypothetical protein